MRESTGCWFLAYDTRHVIPATSHWTVMAFEDHMTVRGNAQYAPVN